MFLKIELPGNPAIPLLGVYLHSHVYYSIIQHNQDRETPKCQAMDEQVKKM